MGAPPAGDKSAMVGALLAVLAALSFSTNQLFVRRGVVHTSPAQGITITVLLGVPLFVVFAAATGEIFRISELGPAAYLLLAAAGVIHYVAGRYSNYRAIQSVGATRTGPFRNMSIPFGLVLAILLLEEEVTPLMGLGIVLALAGPAVTVERRGMGNASTAASGVDPRPPGEAGHGNPAGTDSRGGPSAAASARGEQPVAGQPLGLRQAEGYLFATMAGICYGTTPLLIRAALEDTGLGLLGALVSYLAAGAVVSLALVVPGRVSELRRMQWRTARMFFAASGAVAAAQAFRFGALARAPVVVVLPLERLEPIFVVILSYIVNRRLEFFSGRLVAGVVLSVAGAVLLTTQMQG